MPNVWACPPSLSARPVVGPAGWLLLGGWGASCTSQHMCPHRTRSAIRPVALAAAKLSVAASSPMPGMTIPTPLPHPCPLCAARRSGRLRASRGRPGEAEPGPLESELPPGVVQVVHVVQAPMGEAAEEDHAGSAGTVEEQVGHLLIHYLLIAPLIFTAIAGGSIPRLPACPPTMHAVYAGGVEGTGALRCVAPAPLRLAPMLLVLAVHPTAPACLPFCAGLGGAWCWAARTLADNAVLAQFWP